jgi:hypothetical protein
MTSIIIKELDHYQSTQSHYQIDDLTIHLFLDKICCASANPEVRGRPAAVAAANARRSALVRAGPLQYPAERYHFLSTNDSSPSVAAVAATAKICYMKFFNNTAF